MDARRPVFDRHVSLYGERRLSAIDLPGLRAAACGREQTCRHEAPAQSNIHIKININLLKLPPKCDLYLTIIALTLFASCAKNAPATRTLPGTYTDSFKGALIPATANVSHRFTTSTFEGQGHNLHYPAVCNGHFSIHKDTVGFTNGCAYTIDIVP